MIYMQSIKRRAEEIRYTTLFVASFDSFVEARFVDKEVLAYQADIIDKSTVAALAPAFMAWLIDLWEDMALEGSWPTTRPPIINKWLDETATANHTDLQDWVFDNVTLASDVHFIPDGFQQSDGLSLHDYLSKTKEGSKFASKHGIDSSGVRLSCLGAQGRSSRVALFKDIFDLLNNTPDGKVIIEADYSRKEQPSKQMIKHGLATILGGLSAKGPHYFPDGDKTARKRRYAECFVGYQMKAEAIAEAKFIGASVSFGPDLKHRQMPKLDHDGSATDPMDITKYLQLTTPTDTRTTNKPKGKAPA